MEKKQIRGCWAYLFIAVLMVFSMNANAQRKLLQGTVRDNQGAPLPGVTVVVKGTTTGTITDPNGHFDLEVPETAQTLVFSYIGMLKQEIAIGNQNTFEITLRPDVIGVDEVVVVGYGTRLKEELTGAVSSVSEAELNISPAPSVISRLQGQVSGVTITSANRPGGDATIRIRGSGTINDNNPLYVIDGVPVGPGNNINPNDIESISILKDASSAAIYGTRGANGVVMITTKRGRENQEPRINLMIKSGMTNAVNQYDLLNPQEYADAIWMSFDNRGLTPSHAQYGTGERPVLPDYILPAGAMEGSAGVNPDLYSYPNYQIFRANKEGTNWYDEIYRTGMMQEYDLSVTGGGNKATYAFSGNYLDEDGYVIHSNFKRYTLRMSSDARFNDWLKVGESLQVSYIDEHGRFTDNAEDSPISDAYRMQPIIPVYDIMGNFAGSRAPEMGNAENPVARAYRSRNNNGKFVRILGNVNAEVTLLKGLTAKTLFGFNHGQWNYRGFVIPNYEHSEPNRVNGLNQDSNYELQWNWSNTLNYNTTIGEIHKINAIIGTEAIETKYQSLNASRRNYFSEDPDYMQLNSGESNKENSGEAWEWTLWSVFGRINYDLMGKYFLEATVRRDGSSVFGPEEPYATFPAASAAWAISEESFMAGTGDWLDLLKLRVGWGLSGNNRIQGFYNAYTTFRTDAYRSSYAINGSNTSAVSGFMPSKLGNPNVSWESTETINLGLDGTLFDNTLTFSFDLWRRYTNDMLYDPQIPNILGVVTRPFVNIAEMENKGFDFELGYANSTSDDMFRYSIRATVSRYVNEIKVLTKDAPFEPGQTERQVLYTVLAPGVAYPAFYGYEVAGIFQTQAEADAWPVAIGSDGEYNQPGHFKYVDQLTVDTNGDGIPDERDGIIDDDDRTFIGNPHPDFTGGLNIDLGYGNFDLNVFFYGSYGNDVMNYVTRWIDYGQFNGALSKRALYETWGSPHLDNNANATLPMLDFSSESQVSSSAFVEDGSYLRLKNVRLGYTVPRNVLDRVNIKSLRLYAQVTNLFTLTNYSGLDPEINATGNSMGLDRGAWPTPRQILFGINLGL